MFQDKRSLHLKLQEYCDCYKETDPQQEIENISKAGGSEDAMGDPEEVALKFVCLGVLYGIKESAKSFSLVKSAAGEVQLSIDAAGQYKLPAPPVPLADKIFDVMRSITHLEEEKASEPLALGLGNDQIELGVAFDDAGDKKALTISFEKI